MKKLFAILLSMLMLCTMIPFATVSAAGDYYIELVADAEEVDAGDELVVEVSLYGHESVGLTGCQLELGFDPAVFELVTTFDEDEEMWMPPIEVGSKFNASSNKYIMFPPIDEETGYMERCLVQFQRATATATQAVKTNLFFTVTFKVKDDAPSGEYTIDIINYNKKNIICYGNVVNDYTWEPITVTVNGVAAHEHNYIGTVTQAPTCTEAGVMTYACSCNEGTYTEAIPALDHTPGAAADCENAQVCTVCGAELAAALGHKYVSAETKAPTCGEAGVMTYTCACGASYTEEIPATGEHEFFNDCDTICMICYQEVREASHNVIHVAAKAATCTAMGNIEYWYCDVCGAAWLDAECTQNTNLRAVTLPMAEHEYTYACDKICVNCGEETNPDAAHTIVAVDAVVPTCTEFGNVAYWYCSDCGSAWLDAECTIVTNMMSVKLAPSCSYGAEYHEGVEAGCHYIGMNEYWYCANCDVYYADAACTIVTNYKSLIIPALQDSAEYVPAKAATCDEPGNVEYWICYECEQVWADEALTQLTNIKNVTIAPSHNVIHVDAVAATCYEPGNIEYWYCDVCGSAWTDELCREVTNLKNVVLPITHNIVYVAAKAATCTENGNIEYWYCADCGQAWLDDLCHLNTNLKAVVLAATGHAYADDLDVDCDNCGEIRVVEYVVKTYGGASMQETDDGLSGLAFRFDLTDKIAGLAIKEGSTCKADYSGATVTPNSAGTYKLVKMGAKVSNGVQEIDVEVKKIVLNDSEAYYAIRIINIPEANYDTVLECTPYFVYKNGSKNITVYGETVSASVNGLN